MSLLDGTIRAQLTAKAFFARLADPTLSMDEARRRAAKEIGDEHRKAGMGRRLAAASVQPASHRAEPDHVATLIAKVAAVASRLSMRPPLPRVGLRSTAPAPAPQPVIKRRGLRERIADVLEPEQEEPAPPPPPRPPLVRSPNATNGCTLIGDEEYLPGMRSITTQNWRASVEQNARDYDSKRGGPKRSWYIG
jgi:hypothetical protein